MYKNEHAGKMIARVFFFKSCLKIKESIISTASSLVGLG
jgi:hypothetical protein